MWKGLTVVIANDIDLHFNNSERCPGKLHTDGYHALYDIQLLLGFCKW